MITQPMTLSCRQLFNLQLPTLEKRINQYYQETQNSTTTIKYILALRVRHQLGAKEFAFILKDLVRDIFLHTKATRTMKRFLFYFEDYFLTQEWGVLTLKVFPVRKFIEKAKSTVHSLIDKFRPTETSEP